MEDHKAIKLVVAVGDGLADLVPLVHCDVGGVQQGGKLHHLPLGHVGIEHAGVGIQSFLEGMAGRDISVITVDHTNGAAGIDHANALAHMENQPFW